MESIQYGGRALLLYREQAFHPDSRVMIKTLKRYQGTSLAQTVETQSGITLNLYPRNTPIIIPFPSSSVTLSSNQVIYMIDKAKKRFPNYAENLDTIRTEWSKVKQRELEKERSRQLLQIANDRKRETENQRQNQEQANIKNAQDQRNTDAENARIEQLAIEERKHNMLRTSQESETKKHQAYLQNYINQLDLTNRRTSEVTDSTSEPTIPITRERYNYYFSASAHAEAAEFLRQQGDTNPSDADIKLLLKMNERLEYYNGR